MPPSSSTVSGGASGSVALAPVAPPCARHRKGRPKLARGDKLAREAQPRVPSAAPCPPLRLGRRAAVGAITGTAFLPAPSKAFEVKLPFDEDADTRRRRLNAELKAAKGLDLVRCVVGAGGKLRYV